MSFACAASSSSAHTAIWPANSRAGRVPPNADALATPSHVINARSGSAVSRAARASRRVAYSSSREPRTTAPLAAWAASTSATYRHPQVEPRGRDSLLERHRTTLSTNQVDRQCLSQRRRRDLSCHPVRVTDATRDVTAHDVSGLRLGGGRERRERVIDQRRRELVG